MSLQSFLAESYRFQLYARKEMNQTAPPCPYMGQHMDTGADFVEDR
jgi:hypothetical protein